MKIKLLTAVAAVALAGSAYPAVAQNAATTTTADPYATTTDREDDDDDFPWGLLGLAGLAGLAGLKRRDDDRRTTAGTGTTDRR